MEQTNTSQGLPASHPASKHNAVFWLDACKANHPALRLVRQNAAERQAKGEVGPADTQGPVLLPQCQQEQGQNDIKSAEALSI